MAHPAPFRKTWSLEDTKQYLGLQPTLSTGTVDQQSAWGQQVMELAGSRLASAIGRHVSWVMGQGLEVIPNFCEHVQLPLINHLRALDSNPKDDAVQQLIGERFANHMAILMCFSPSQEESLDPMVVHAKLVETVEKGRFRFSAVDMGVDPMSGQRLDVRFDGWKATAGTGQYLPGSDGSHRRYGFVPLSEGQIRAQVAQVVSVPIPTGELWVADWFRIPAFMDLCKPIDDDPGNDINTVGGRAERTRRYAQELGVGHVACFCPSLLQGRGLIKAGFLAADARVSGSVVGEIDSPLRWVTLVDRGHLVALLSSSLGDDEARRQVDEYAQSTPGLTRIKVEPGTHHLYFSGSPLVFQKTMVEQFEVEGLGLGDLEEPAFVLTQAPLSPSPSLTPAKKGPRP